MFDFDTIHNRESSNSIKWNGSFLKKIFGKRDILPLWVADMDFKASDVLIRNLEKRAKHGFYGYEFQPDSIKNAILLWCKKRHDWNTSKECISFAPSVLTAISILIEIESKKGDGVIIQPPVYYPFEAIIRSLDRIPVYNKLKEEDGYHRFNLDDLKRKASSVKNKLMILSSPHNPVGRVWKKNEIIQLAQICYDNGVRLISDEIHMEFIFNDNSFYSTALLDKELRRNSVQLFSAGKTFNLSGCANGIVHFTDEKLQNKFTDFLMKYQLTSKNVFTTIALETAFTEGEEWFSEMLSYINENLKYVELRIKKELPRVKYIKPEGTYLIWLDFSDYLFKDDELEKFLLERASVALDPGRWFGELYCSYARLNIGCSRKLLKKALDQIISACNEL